MKYNKSESVFGKWFKGSEIKSGTKCILVSEVKSMPSQFKDKQGNVKNQDVGKIQIHGIDEALNININRPSLNALIDAFGDDSIAWQGKELTIETEKVRVGGVARVAVYLVPQGYEKTDDENGYATIVKEGTTISMPPLEDEPSVNSEDFPF